VWFSTQENPTMTAFTKLKLVNAQADQKTPMVVRRSKLTGKLDLQIALAKAQTEGADFVASRKKTVIDRETGLKKRVDAAMTVRQWWWTNQAGAVVLGLRYGSKPIEIAKGIEVPRDRHGSFQPQLIPKHQTRWAGFDDKIISLYARGMTVREIQAHLAGDVRHRGLAQPDLLGDRRRQPTRSRPGRAGRSSRSTPSSTWTAST
jgi:hypothetical protein